MSCARKRTNSITCTSSKRKKRSFGPHNKRGFIPPTKFLLGGNIRDPLNLCGLQNQPDTNETEDFLYPGYSEFLLGGDIHDPLNLKGIQAADNESSGNHNGEELMRDNNNVVSKNKLAGAETLLPYAVNECDDECKKTDALLEHPQLLQCKKQERKDKIVSPVIPQPYRPLKNLHFKQQMITPDVAKDQKTPKFKEKNSRFQFGNYNRYYGYRNVHHGVDMRLEILANYRSFFSGKDILDIGCNIGHISLIISRDFSAKSVTGLDIDRSLIDIAKKNIKHYINCTSPYSTETTPCHSKDNTNELNKVDLKYKCYPVSMPILYGPVCENDLKERRTFPKNVSFIHGNYVLESDALLQLEAPQFDTILCLSTIKWLHLNFGDVGLKRAFKRMFLQLRPGGVLIIEPQSWDSYSRKKSLTEVIWKNYQHIQLFPHHFDRYLLSQEVGFSTCQTLALVNHQQKGFRRPLKVFVKPVSHFTTDV